MNRTDKPAKPIPTPSIIVAGHICLDIIPEMGLRGSGSFWENFQPGHLLEVGKASMSTGGPISNTGLALHRLGIPTRLICKTGPDAFGRIIKRLVEVESPELIQGILTDPNEITSYSLIISPVDVDRIILHNPGANNSFNADDIDYALVSQSSLFHFGYPPAMRRMYENNGQGLIEMFRRAKLTGVTTSLDMSYPDPESEAGKVDWAAILKAVLPFVDIFLPSIEEILFMLRRSVYGTMQASGDLLRQVSPSHLHDLSDEILCMGARLVVIKLGERGLYLRSAGKISLEGMGRASPSNLQAWSDKELWSPCFKVKVVGTLGAGDTTIAGFLAALLRNLGPEEAVSIAAAVGACNVEAADALRGLLSWEDTLHRIKSGWEKVPMRLEEPAWHSNETDQIWFRDQMIPKR